MSDDMQPCTSAPGTQEEANDEEEEEELDIYDPGDDNPYTREYIYKHEPFRRIPNAYYPDDGFEPACLVFGIGLLFDEAVAYAEEHEILGPPGSEYSAMRTLFGFQDMASRFSALYGHRIEVVTVMSRKCDIVLVLFDNYSRPDDVEIRRQLRDILKKLVEIFPAALEKIGYFYSTLNDSMYPEYVRTRTLTLQESEEVNEEEDEPDIYDPGDTDPYTREYIYKHEPFRHIPNPYYPDDGFEPACLVFGLGLMFNEAVAYAEEQGILGPPGSEYSAMRMLFGFQDMASRFSALYGHRIKVVTVMSRKCDMVLVLFDNYSRPEDVEIRRELRDILKKLVEIFPAALKRIGYFYSTLNDNIYPEYPGLMCEE